MEIARAGRWRYELSYFPDGLNGDGDTWISFEGPTVLGRRRAERRARRDLRRLARIHGTPEIVSVVT
jgi:hypothetical protein